MGGLKFGTDGEGNYGYLGADGSLIPFSSANAVNIQEQGLNSNVDKTLFTATKNGYVNIGIFTYNLNLMNRGTVKIGEKSYNLSNSGVDTYVHELIGTYKISAGEKIIVNVVGKSFNNSNIICGCIVFSTKKFG